MIKKEIIDRVRNETDIVDLIGSYLPLKKAGKYYRALCPFHAEKAPSFYVSPERQIYHCFGCGAGGSALTFVMNFEKLSFPEAVKTLANRLGIMLDFDKVSTTNQPLYDTCEFAANFFTQQLNKSELAQNYLKKRGLKPETIERFRLGFAPGGNRLLGEAKKHNIKEDLLLTTGLAVKKEAGYYDWFFNRLMFPIFSLSGRVIGFGGRVLDPAKEPKYINSPETTIFRKGENFYGLFQAKNHLRESTPIVVEGNFDLLSLVDKDIPEVVAPLGTALTNEQALILRRYSNCAIIAFDGDSSGRAATQRALELMLKASVEPQILVLPDGYDPDKYILQYGKDGLRVALSKVQDFVGFVSAMMPNRTISEKRAVLKRIIELASLIGDEITQELYLNKIAQIYNLDKVVLRSCWQKKEPKRIELTTKTDNRVEKLLATIIQNAEYAQMVIDELPLDAIDDVGLRTIAKTIYENARSNNEFGFTQLIDFLPSEDLKSKVTSWAFHKETSPNKEQFILGFKNLKVKLLSRARSKAKETDDKATLEHTTQDFIKSKKEFSDFAQSK
jgi:DNA primase